MSSNPPPNPHPTLFAPHVRPLMMTGGKARPRPETILYSSSDQTLLRAAWQCLDGAIATASLAESGCLREAPEPHRNSQFRPVVWRLSAVCVLWGFSSAAFSPPSRALVGENAQRPVLPRTVNVAWFPFRNTTLCFYNPTDYPAVGPIPHSWNHSRYFPKAPKPQFRAPPAASSVTRISWESKDEMLCRASARHRGLTQVIPLTKRLQNKKLRSIKRSLMKVLNSLFPNKTT